MESGTKLHGQLKATFFALLSVFSLRPAGADVADGEPFDLLIIAPEEFRTPLLALEAHKDSTGLPTDVVDLERVLRFFPENPEYDPPERIKGALGYYRERFGIRYALLVGDADKFPVRWVAQNAAGEPDKTLYYFPSDLYYADLYDARGRWNDWNADAGDRFGEHLVHANCALDPFAANVDRCDLRPDIAVGRVPASTAEEVDRYVAKVIRYEYEASGSTWARKVLLLAGASRKHDCDPGIHFWDIKRYLGTDFRYTIYVRASYYDRSLDPDQRACECDPLSITPITCSCLEGFTRDQKDIFNTATHWSDDSPVPESAFEEVGFLAWHDHTSTIADCGDIANEHKYTIAFSDGCEDGAFPGSVPGGFYRFVPASARGPEAPYLTETGSLFRIVFEPRWLVDSNGESIVDGDGAPHYCILGCEVDGVLYPRDGDRFADLSPTRRFPFPRLRIADDFGAACAANPLASPAHPKPRHDRDLPYIYNAPPPASLQPQPDVPDEDQRNSETKLFALRYVVEEIPKETGWVGVVAATKGASFPTTGELETLFFRGYRDPHPSVAGRNRLGDMWRSMIEHMLDYVVDPATGLFDFTAYVMKCSLVLDYPTECWSTIQQLMMM